MPFIRISGERPEPDLMATRSSARARPGSGFAPFLLGFVLAVALTAAGLWAYLHFGNVPVATADAPFPMERQIASGALDARIKRDLKQPPFGISEDVFEGGAHLYATHCAFCHGTPGRDSMMASAEYPHAPQLWKKHAHGSVVGVSDDEPGETEWKIANGIRLSGMPAYNHVLSETGEWQIALLLKNADQPLPDPVRAILAGAVVPQAATKR